MYQYVLSLSWNSKDVVVKMTKFFHEDMKKLELTYGPEEFNLKKIYKKVNLTYVHEVPKQFLFVLQCPKQ